MPTNHSTMQDQRPNCPDTRQRAARGAASSASIIPVPCATRTNPAPTPVRRRKAVAGFTLIEMLIAVSVTGVSTTLTMPTFEGHLQRARRSDVLISMMQVQAAQERWRSNGARYGNLADIGAPSTSASGYEVLATAVDTQARDATCRNMSVRVLGANLTYASGSDTTLANPASVNAKCWSL